MKKIYNKLVRDKIPEIIKNNGDIPEIQILAAKNKKDYLQEKLFEEARELIEAKDRKETLGELADILEVLMSISKESAIDWKEVEEFRRKKLDERGGFEKGIFLISTEEK